jgi:D-glycero-D-manno-heptose 1,7-bisphosphate phosphatase
MKQNALHQHTIILDRDGVINLDSPEYIKSVDEFKIIDGSLEAIAQLYQAGFQIFVVTNQSGLGRHYFTKATLDAIHDQLTGALWQHHAKLSGIYYCPHIPEDQCSCRKPKPGLLLQLAAEQRIDLAQAIVIGDSVRDLEAGAAAGCIQRYLVLTGNGQKTLEKNPDLIHTTHIARDLSTAAHRILTHHLGALTWP